MSKHDIPGPGSLYAAFCYGLGFREASATDAVEQVFHALVHAWTEPHRTYHSLQHHLVPLVAKIAEAGVEGVFDSELNFRATLVAAFYHDYVYGTAQPDSKNVAQSEQQWNADAMLIYGDRLRDTSTYSFVQAIASEIATTDYANRENFNRGSDDWLREDVSLIDFDLMNLCGHPSFFALHKAKVRQEWAHVNDGDFRRGRIAFLKTFLAIPRLYHASLNTQETQARANMGTELAVLLIEEEAHPKPCCSNPTHMTVDGDPMPCGHHYSADGDIVPDRKSYPPEGIHEAGL